MKADALKSRIPSVPAARGRAARTRLMGAARRDPRWTEQGRRAFAWFLGDNHLRQTLFDAATGGCRDGVHSDRLNQNQGAEATLSFLLALCDMGAAVEVRVHDTAAPLHETS